MTKHSVLLLRVNESKAKKLAQAISNETCRKLLDELAKGATTETDLAKKLNIPISTVHYNLQQLIESRLVEAEEFHYSVKGKEVLHYSLANRYVIIAPMNTESGFLEKLQRVIPVFAVIGAMALAMRFIASTARSALQTGTDYADQAIVEETLRAAPKMAAAEPAAESFMLAGAQPAELANAATQTVTSNPIGHIWWFVAGAVAAVVIYILIDLIIKKLRK